MDVAVPPRASRAARGTVTSNPNLLALESALPRGVAHKEDPTSRRPVVDGKQLLVRGERFWIRGVTYGTFTPNSRGELFPEPEAARRDLEQMAAAGVNTVRTYVTPPQWFMDLAQQNQLMVVAGVFWNGHRFLYDDPSAIQREEAAVLSAARKLAGHPALLMVCLGNEIPPLVARWHGKTAVEQVLRRLRDGVKEVDPAQLVTYASYPPTEFLDLSFFDVVSFNVYLEREAEFRAYLARLQMLAGDRPLFLSEMGVDSRHHGLDRQAEVLEWQLRAVREKGLAGAAVFAWTDEWAVEGTPMEDWDFGLVDRERKPKPAFEVVRRSYQGCHYTARRSRWPSVSVICCAHNAAATLDETLASLTRLNYPSYEVIVVDDGSRDATAAIARKYPCHCIRMPHGGLSRARNTGAEAARGEIIAYIDSDAVADPDWLYFLVTQMEEQEAAGCGGPNLSPPEDPEPAQQVARSPGNPVHVLLDNETAEHLPGCNMAFRKTALQRVGCFDPVYRSAGDDVDVCWKLLEQGETLAFSPAALVWHHRRPNQRAYLRQQEGYGFAEALLEARYPERYGLTGGAVWRGRVYDGPQPAAPPWLAAQQSRIYHGAHGNALFQSVYTPGPPWWLSFAVQPEFHALTASCGVAGVTLAISGQRLWYWPSAVAVSGLLVSGVSCLQAARQMCARDELRGLSRLRRIAGVARLHFLQPLARWVGRLRGGWQNREEHSWPREPQGSFWAEPQAIWSTREQWLTEVARRLGHVGMEVRSDEWGRYDLRIETHGGYSALLESGIENPSTFRFRAKIRTGPRARGLETALLVLMAAAVAGQISGLPVLPLLLPPAWWYLALRRERRRLGASLATVGCRVAEALGMVSLQEPAARAAHRSADAQHADPRPAAGGATTGKGLVHTAREAETG